MLISTRGRYALRVMVDLSAYPMGVFVPIKDISEKENLSKEYLNTILKELVESGLLKSLRGKGGGYQLVKEPERYTVLEILIAVKEDLSPVPCVKREDCPNSSTCHSLPMWVKLDKMIFDFFNGITLKDLATKED